MQLIKFLKKQDVTLNNMKGPCSVATILEDGWFGGI